MLSFSEQLPLGDIEIKTDNEKPYVRIHQGHIITFRPLLGLPSEKVFECYNRIAKHIRKLSNKTILTRAPAVIELLDVNQEI